MMQTIKYGFKPDLSKVVLRNAVYSQLSQLHQYFFLFSPSIPLSVLLLCVISSIFFCLFGIKACQTEWNNSLTFCSSSGSILGICNIATYLGRTLLSFHHSPKLANTHRVSNCHSKRKKKKEKTERKRHTTYIQTSIP